MSPTSLDLLFGSFLLVLPATYLFQKYLSSHSNTPSRDSEPEPEPEKPQEKAKTTGSIMQAERTDLAPPRDDPFTLEQLKQFDGVDESKPIYVAIKGTVFDVSHKRDTYGPGKSYNIFAGKDASKGLGMSSLKTEDAIPDYSGLSESERKVLDDWHGFFIKRYNIVGRVVDLPPSVANL